jgi:hypothetical protein
MSFGKNYSPNSRFECFVCFHSLITVRSLSKQNVIGFPFLGFIATFSGSVPSISSYRLIAIIFSLWVVKHIGVPSGDFWKSVLVFNSLEHVKNGV